MEFSMRDIETAIAMNTNGVVNVQQKKQFDIADVENNEMKLENDDWNIDSIFPLNNDFLNDLGDINMDANWADAYDYMSSPTSTGTGTESENDHDMLGMKPSANQMLSPPQNLISSSSSDSGLSSDHVDFDMNFDQLSTDLLQQPLLSNQIIPELVEPKPAQLPVSIQVEPKIIKTQQNNLANVIETKTIPEVKAKPTNAPVVQIKSSDISQKQRVQIIKKIPSNIVKIADSNGKFKLNQAVISENIISNNPIVINKFNGNISGIRKVIQLKKSPNQKPIILPFTLKNGTDIRSIKIIKPSSLTKSPKILMAASNLLQEYKQNEMKQNAIIVNKPIKLEPKYEIDSMSEPSDCESYKFEDMIVQDDEDVDDADDYNNDSDQGVETDQQSEYPKLVLSGEEKRLLAKEGIKLPAHYPLTKQEERELKRIRRKIRNKISAQDSRKRKKEYVDGLEERVKKCTDENQTLIKRIKLLQTQNQNLINQMKKMQNLLTKGGNKSVQPATCLMVLLMSMALIAAPNLKLNNKDNNTDEALTQELQMMDNNDIQQNRRALLFDSKEKFSDMGDMVADEEMGSDFNMLYDKSENEHNYAETQTKLSSNRIDQLVVDFDVDDTVWDSKMNASRDLITPKVEPQLKNGDSIRADHIMKYDFNQYADSSESTVTHSKPTQNLSDLPSNDEFQLKLAKIETNIIDLNTEIDAKNV